MIFQEKSAHLSPKIAFVKIHKLGDGPRKRPTLRGFALLFQSKASLEAIALLSRVFQRSVRGFRFTADCQVVRVAHAF